MNDPRSFGATLRRERERRGVTLDAIAEQTKISVPLLAGLERGDLSRWPGGIFRRAFIRGYAEALGLDAASVVETFVRVCPEPGAPAIVEHLDPPTGLSGPRPLLRLTLADDDAQASYRIIRGRVAAAAMDAVAVVVPGLCAGLVGGATAGWAALALFAVAYHVVGALMVGATPATWYLSRPVVPRAVLPEHRDADAGDHEPVPGDVAPEEAASGDGVRRPAELFFTPRRRDRRQGARPDRLARRPSDSRAARH